MLDDTPCFPDIEQALTRYFGKLQRRFSMLLTYHPTIDCEHGRYLLLNDSLSSHVFDGTGSQLMWYLGVLNVAYTLNLTLIHLEWTATHVGEEKNSDREKYWQFFDWEIPYSAYQSCPQNSSIKRNIFRYDLIANQTFDQYHDAYIHPLWLGIIMLFTVIIVMSIACLIRIKYGSQILHLFIDYVVERN